MDTPTESSTPDGLTSSPMTCNKCHQEKPADSFKPRRNVRKNQITYSRRGTCIDCDNEMRRDRERQKRAVKRALSLQSQPQPTQVRVGEEVPMSDVERRRRLAAAEAM